MEWQPVVTLIAAIIAAATSAFTLWKLHAKKRNDDLDLKAFDHSLTKRLKEFEQKLIEDNSYLTEKGKNIATKEDIEEITHKVESIRIEFATTTEVLKSQLSKRINLHKLQAEKEFEVYTKMWDILTELRLAFEEHRPLLDLQLEGTDWNELWKKRSNTFINHRNQLLTEVERQKPFYSKDMYFELRKLLGIATAEMIDFDESFEINGKMSHDGKTRGKENLDKFTDSLETVCELMRFRITES